MIFGSSPNVWPGWRGPVVDENAGVSYLLLVAVVAAIPVVHGLGKSPTIVEDAPDSEIEIGH